MAFCVQSFFHTLSKKLDASTNGHDPSFGFDIATDELYNRAYISDVADKSCAAKMLSSRKAARNKIRGAYIVFIDGERVFTKEDATRVLQRLYKDQVAEFVVEVAPEKRLDASERRGVPLSEHERSLFRPDAPDDEHTAALTVDHLRVIALHVYPHLDFREQNVSVDELNLCINSISSRALTDEEAALGSFTRRKLKTLSTWPEWQAGERKQLDRFHAVRMFGEPVPRPADPKAIILRPHWQ